MTGTDVAKGRKKFTIGMIAAALIKHDGLVPRAAEELKTDRQTIHDRISRSAELQATIRDIDEGMKVNARGAIAEALRAKDMPTVRWYAERKMRDEGFGTRIETGVDTAQIERIVEAIAKGGPTAIRSVLAAVSGARQ